MPCECVGIQLRGYLVEEPTLSDAIKGATVVNAGDRLIIFMSRSDYNPDAFGRIADQFKVYLPGVEVILMAGVSGVVIHKGNENGRDTTDDERGSG